MQGTRGKTSIAVKCSLSLKFIIFLALFPIFIPIENHAAENCTAKGCHDGYLKEPNVHAPVRGRNCGRCHGGEDHPYPLIKKKEEICGTCHKMTRKKSFHPPVKDGDCVACHNPHASKDKKLLKKPMPELCFDCHDQVAFKNKNIHQPVKEDCMSCHFPHDGDYKKLLKEEGKKLCYICHDPKDKEKNVHPPVADDCMGCHNPHSTSAKALLLKEGNDLCFLCHEGKTYVGKPVVHAPVKENCRKCHLHHDGKLPKLLKSETICIDCHGTMINGKNIHSPVESKDCMGCHTPHTSNEKKLLKEPMPKLCFSCHDKGPFTKKVIHKPVKAECNLCHAPHSSGAEKLLVAKKEKLCENCHKESVVRFKRYKYPHPPVKDGQCGQCHDPHSTAFSKLTIDSPVFLCGNCHDIGDAKKAKSVHSPVDEGRCGGCHDVHGGEQRDFLLKSFSTDNYRSYSPNLYELCFECHSSDIPKHQKTLTATEFRNGDVNLHYVHVNKDKSRSCKFCHDPHMSMQEKLVKPAFKGFGAWSIPIVFSKTVTGGGCVVGCHKPYYYDRMKPVKRK